MTEFYSELLSQPKALKTLIEKYRAVDYAPIRQAAQMIRQRGEVIFSGMGTSYFAPTAIRSSLAPYAKVIQVEAGELLEGSLSMVQPEDVVFLISQSGESVELVKVAQALRNSAAIICITNDTQSSLAKSANVVLPLYCEKEKSITNKTYTNTLAVLYLLAEFVADGSIAQLETQIQAASEEMQAIVSNPETEHQFRELADYLAPAQAIHFIGRGGAGLVSSYQASLIFMEGAKCATHGFSTGAFRHGPIEVCGETHRAVIFAQQDDNLDKTLVLAEKISQNRSKVLLVTNTDYQNKTVKTVPVQVKSTIGFSLVSALIFELLLVFVAENKNLVAGRFSITSKISRVE